MVKCINKEIIERKIKAIQTRSNKVFWMLNKFCYGLAQSWVYKPIKIFCFPPILFFIVYFLKSGLVREGMFLIGAMFIDFLVLRFAMNFLHYNELIILKDIFKEGDFNEKYLKKVECPNQKVDAPLSMLMNKPGRDYTSYKETLVKEYIHKKKIKRKQVLEIGCGTGRVSEFYSKEGNTVFALDISFHYLSQIQDRGIHRILAHASHIPFKNNSFDIINFTEVIEHLNNPQKALEEIYRLLKEDGGLVLSTGNNRHYLSFKCLNPLIFLENIIGAYFPKFLPPRKLIDVLEGISFYHVRFAKAELIGLLSGAKFRFQVKTFGHLLSLRLPLQLIIVLEKYLANLPFIKNLGAGYFIIAKKQE